MEEGAVVTFWQGVLSYLHPALLWYWFTGPHSWIYRIYRNIKSGFDPRFRRRRRRLLSWMGQASGRDVADLASVWRDGTILCDLIHRSCPSACLGHEESHVQDNFRHAQALAYRCLLLQPAFTEDELGRPELTPQIERRLFRYLQSLRQAISKKQLNRSAEEESDGEAHVAEEYITRGMGLIMASTSQRAIFYVYSRDGSSLMDIHIEIRGPGDDFGSILVTESESYDNPTGASIVVEYRLTEEYLRVSYQPRSVGHHELSISRHGYNVPGSPFLVSVDEISEKIPKKRFNSVEWFTEDEERRQKELQEKKKKAKVKYRIVDFVTEKMYLTEDGKLLNIPPEDVQCVTPPPPDFPAPIPPPTPDIPLLTPPSPTSSTDSRSQCKKGRTLSPRPRRKRGERTKWTNIKQERMKYIIVKPQKAELKRVSDAAAQVTLEFQPSMFQERCKRIVTVCDYLLQHCPRQTSLEIISGAGHILQSLQSYNENSVINKPRVSEPDDDDDVFVPATAPSPTTVRTITYPQRCRSVSLTHVKDGLNDNVQKEAEHSSRDSYTERRRESDSSITHLASEARKCFRYEGNTKTPGRRTSFSSIYQVSDSKSQNKSTVDEDSYDLLTVTDDHIVYSEERPDHTAIDAEIKLVNYKQFSNERLSSELRVNYSTPDGVLLETINNPSILVDVYNNTTLMGEPSPKSTQASDTLNDINNSDFNRQINKEEIPSKETNDKILLPKGNNVGKIIARFETNLSLEQDRGCSLSSNLAVSCLEIEKPNVKHTSEPPLFKDPVSGKQINVSKENDNLDNDKKLQIEYLKSIGAPLSTIRSKIQLFEKGIVKETCTSTIPAPDTEAGINSLNTSQILYTRDQNRISTEDEAVNIFRAEPAMVVSKHYAELQEISVNTEPVIEGIIFDFQPKRSPSKTSSAQVLTDKVKMQGKTCESEYKLDTWDPGILQGSKIVEANILSESTVVGDNYIPSNNQHSNPIISEIDDNKENFPRLTIKENPVCLTESTSNDKEKSNKKMFKTGSKLIDTQQFTFYLTTEETPENTIWAERSLLTSTLIPNNIHTTVGSNHTEDEQIRFLTNEDEFRQENCVTERDKPTNEHITNDTVNQPSAENGLKDPTFDGGAECRQSEQQEGILTKSQLGIVNYSKTCQVNVKEFESPRYEILLESQSNETVACIEGDSNQNSESATIHAIIEGSEQSNDKPNLDTSQREEVTDHLRNECCEYKHDATKFLDREMSNGEHISEKGKYLQENTVKTIECSAKEELKTVAEVLHSESDLIAPCVNDSTDETSLRKYEFPTEIIQPLVEKITKYEDISDSNVSVISECGVVSSDIFAIDLKSKEVDNSLNKIDHEVIFHKIATEAEFIEDCQQIDIRNPTIIGIDYKKEQTSDIILVKTKENLDLESIDENVNIQIKKEHYNIPISGFTQKLVNIFENIFDQSPINNFNKDPNDGHIPTENYVNPVSLESLTDSIKASVACTQVTIASNETNGVEVKGLTKKLVKLFENIYEPVSTEHTINPTTEYSTFLENVENITSIDKERNSSIIQKGPTLNQHALENKANITSSTSSSFNGLTKRLIEVFDDISEQKNNTHSFGQVNLDDSKALSDTIISLPPSFCGQEAEQCSHGSANLFKISKANQVDFVGDATAIPISEKECSTKHTTNVTDEQGGQEVLMIETERNPENTVTSVSDKVIELNSRDPIRNEDCEKHMQLGQCIIKVVTKDGIRSENQSVNEFSHVNGDNSKQTSTLTFGDPINGEARQETGNIEVFTKETIIFEHSGNMNLTGIDQNLAYDVGLIHKATKGSAKEIESKIRLEANTSDKPNVIDQAITGTVLLEQDDTILLNKECDQTHTADGSLKKELENVLSVGNKRSLEQRDVENINICNQPPVSDDYLMIKQPVIQLEREPNKANKIKDNNKLDSNVSDDIPIVEKPVGKQEPTDSLMKGNIDCYDLLVPEALTITELPVVESLEPTVAKNRISVNQLTVKQEEDENKVVTNGRKDCMDITIDERLNITKHPVIESVNNKTTDMLIENERFIELTLTDKLSIVDQPAIELEQDETKVLTLQGQDSLYLAVPKMLTITERPAEESKNDKTKDIPIENEEFLEPTVPRNLALTDQPIVTLEHDENKVMTIESNDVIDPSFPEGFIITEQPVVESKKDKYKDKPIENKGSLERTVNENPTFVDQPPVTLEHNEKKVMTIESNNLIDPNVHGGLIFTEQHAVELENDKSKDMPNENEGCLESTVAKSLNIVDQPTVSLEQGEIKVLTFESKDCSDLTVEKRLTFTEQPAVESENGNFKVIPIENEELLEPTVTENLTIDDQPVVTLEHDENIMVMTIKSNDFIDPNVPESLIVTEQPVVESEKDQNKDMLNAKTESMVLTVVESLTIVNDPSLKLDHDETKALTFAGKDCLDMTVDKRLIITEQPAVESENDNLKTMPIENEELFKLTVTEKQTIDDQPVVTIEHDKNKVIAIKSNDVIDPFVPEGFIFTEQPEVESEKDKSKDMSNEKKESMELTTLRSLTTIDQPIVELEQGETKVLPFVSKDSLDLTVDKRLTINEPSEVKSENDNLKDLQIENGGFLEPTVTENQTIEEQPIVTLKDDGNKVLFTIESNDFIDPFVPEGLIITEQPEFESDKDKTKDMSIESKEFLEPTVDKYLTFVDHPTVTLKHDENKVITIESNDFMDPNVPEGFIFTEQPVVESENDNSKNMPNKKRKTMELTVVESFTIVDQPTVKLEQGDTKVLTFGGKECSDLTIDERLNITEQPEAESGEDKTKVMPIESEEFLEHTVNENLPFVDQPSVTLEHAENKVMNIESNDFMDPNLPECLIITAELVDESENDKTKDMPNKNKEAMESTVVEGLNIIDHPTVILEHDRNKIMTIESNDFMDSNLPEGLIITEQHVVESKNDKSKDMPNENKGCLESTVAEGLAIIDRPTVILEHDKNKLMTIESNDFMNPNVPEGPIFTEQPEVESGKGNFKVIPIEKEGLSEPTVTKSLTIDEQPFVTLEHDENKVMTIKGNDFMDPSAPGCLIITEEPVVESENDKSKDMPNENKESLESAVAECFAIVDQPTVTLKHDENNVINIKNNDFMDTNLPEGLIITEEYVVESENGKTKDMPNENKESMESTVAEGLAIIDRPTVILEHDKNKLMTIESNDFIDPNVPEGPIFTEQPEVESGKDNFKVIPIEKEGLSEPTVTKNLTIDEQPTVTLEHEENKVMTIKGNNFMDPSATECLINTEEPVFESENDKSKDITNENKESLESAVAESFAIFDQPSVTLKHDENNVMNIKSNDFTDPNLPEGLIITEEYVVESENGKTKVMPNENKGSMESTVAEGLAIIDRPTVILEHDKNKLMTIESNDVIDPNVPEGLIFNEQPEVESGKDNFKVIPIEKEGLSEPTVTKSLTIDEQPSVTLEHDENKVMTIKGNDFMDPSAPGCLIITEEPVVESENDKSKDMPNENKESMESTVAEGLAIIDRPTVILEHDKNKLMTIESNDVIDPNVPEFLIFTEQPEVESGKYNFKVIPIEKEGLLEPTVTKNLTIDEQPTVTLEHDENKVMTIKGNDFMDPSAIESLINTEEPVVESENDKSKDITNENKESLKSAVAESFAIIDRPTVILEHDKNKLMTIESNDVMDPNVPEGLIFTEQPEVYSGKDKFKVIPIEKEGLSEPTVTKNLTIDEQPIVTLEHDENKVMSIKGNDFMDPSAPGCLIITEEPVFESENDKSKDMPNENKESLESAVAESFAIVDQPTVTLKHGENNVMNIKSNDFMDPNLPEGLIITEEYVVESENGKTKDMPNENKESMESTVAKGLAIIDRPTVILEHDKNKLMTIESNDFIDPNVPLFTEQPVVDLEKDKNKGMSNEKKESMELTTLGSLTIIDQHIVELEQGETKVLKFKSKDSLDLTVDKRLHINEQPLVKSENYNLKDIQIENEWFLEPTVTQNQTIDNQPIVTPEHDDNKVMTIESNDFIDPFGPEGLIITEKLEVESYKDKTKDIPIESKEFLLPSVNEVFTIVHQHTVTLEHDENKVISIESDDLMDSNVAEGLIITDQPELESEKDTNKDMIIENKGFLEPIVVGLLTIVEQPTVTLQQGETEVLKFESKDCLDLTVDKRLTITEQPVVKSDNDNLKDIQIENEVFLEPTVTENLTIDYQPIVTLEHDENKVMTIKSNGFIDPSVSEGLIITVQPKVESDKDVNKNIPIENEACMELTVTENLTNVDEPADTLGQCVTKVVTFESKVCLDVTVDECLTTTEQPVVESEYDKTKDMPNKNEESLESTVAKRLTSVNQPIVNEVENKTNIVTNGRKDCLDQFIDDLLNITEHHLVESENNNTMDMPVENKGCPEPTVKADFTIVHQPTVTLDQYETKVLTVEGKYCLDLSVPEGLNITKQPAVKLEQDETITMTVESKHCFDATVPEDLILTEQTVVESGNDKSRDMPIENEGFLETTVIESLTIVDQPAVTLEQGKTKVVTVDIRDCVNLSEAEVLTITVKPVVELENDKARDMPIETEECLKPTVTENLTIVDQPTVTLEQDETKVVTIESKYVMDAAVLDFLPIIKQPMVESENNIPWAMKIENEACLEQTGSEIVNIDNQSNVSLEQYDTNIMHIESRDCLISIPEVSSLIKQPEVEFKNDGNRDMNIENEASLRPSISKTLTIVEQEVFKSNIVTVESKDFISLTMPDHFSITEQPVVESKNDETGDKPIESEECLEQTCSVNRTFVGQHTVTLEQDKTKLVTVDSRDCLDLTEAEVLTITEKPVIESGNDETRDLFTDNEGCSEPTVDKHLTIIHQPTVTLEEDETKVIKIDNKDCLDLTVDEHLTITEMPVVELENDKFRDVSIENDRCLESTVTENINFTLIEQPVVDSENNETRDMPTENVKCLEPTVTKNLIIVDHPIVDMEQETMETKTEYNSCLESTINYDCTIIERLGFVLEHDETKETIIENSLEPTLHNESSIFEQHVVVLDQDESKKNNLEQTTTEIHTVDNQLADIPFDLKENKAIAMHNETASNVKLTVTEDLTVYDEFVHLKNYQTKLITEEGELNLDKTRTKDHFVGERPLDKPFVEESGIADSNAYIYKEQEGINMCMIFKEAILNEEVDRHLGTRDENKQNFPAKELYLQLVGDINSQSDHTSNKESNSLQTNNSLPLDLIQDYCEGHLPQDINECSLDSKCENYEITTKGFQTINENTKCNERTVEMNETQFESVSNSFEQKISIASKIKQFIFPESDEYDLKHTDNPTLKENIKEHLILKSYRCMEANILLESSSNTPEPTILSSAILNKRQSSGGKEKSLVQQLKQRFERSFSNVETCKDLKILSVSETDALENQEIRGLCGNDLMQKCAVFENKNIAAINTDTKKEETQMSTHVCNQVCSEGRLINERCVESHSLKTIWDYALDPSISTLESSGKTTNDTFLSNKYSSIINFENEEIASKNLFSNTPIEGVRNMLSIDSEMLNNNLLTVEQELSEVLSIEDEELDRSLEKEIYDIEAMETPDLKYDDHFHFQEHNREFVDDSKDAFAIENEKLDIQTQQQIIEIDQMLCPAESESSIKITSVYSTCNKKRVIRVDPSLLSFDPMDDEISSLEGEKLDEEILTEISKVESVAYNEGGISEPMSTVQDYHTTIIFPTVNTEIVDDGNILEEELDEETQKILQEVDDPRDITTGCYLSNDNIETSHSAIGFFSGYSTLGGTFSPCPPEKKHDSNNCVTEKYKLVPTEYGDLSSYNGDDEAIIEDRMNGDEYGAGEYMVDTDGSTKNSTLLQHDMNNYEFFNPATSKSELNLHIDSDQVDYYDEVNTCSAEAMFSSLQSETTGAGESFSERLEDFKGINLSLSTESDSSEFHMWSSNVEFGEPGDASTIQEGMDFDSIISAPNLDEALKKLEMHIQDKGEGFQWLSTRTPSPSLQSLEKCFKDGVPFFDTEEFYSQVSGGIISGNVLTPQDYSSNENKDNTAQIDIWATPCENLPSCTYVQSSLEADGLESECQEEQHQDWIISPYQYPRVIFGNTTQMSIIDEEDDLRKSEPTSPQQIKFMNLKIDNTHISSEIMSSTKDIASHSSLYDTEINDKAKDIHSLNARFSIEESDCVNEYNIRDLEQTLIINQYKPEIESCLINSMLEINAITSAITNDPEETNKNKISSTEDKLAFQAISLDHNNINRITSENILQDDIDQSKGSLNESNLIFTKNTNTVNKEGQQMYKAPKLTDAKFYAMNKDHVESKIENDLGSYLNIKCKISLANDEFDCMGNIQKEIIQDDTLSNLNPNYPKDKRIREEIKYLLEHNIDSVTEEVINEFSVSERKMYWDAKLEKLQDLESQSSTYSGPKSLSKIKSGTVSKLVSCFGQTNEDVPALPILQKQTNIFPKTSSYKTINKPETDHKYKEENIDIAEKIKIESYDQSQCVDTKTTVQSTASMKLVSHWKTYWDDMINDQTENNNSEQRAVYKIPSIQISEDDESGVTTVLYDEVSSNHNCNKEILKEKILSPLPMGDTTQIEHVVTKIDQEWPSPLNLSNKLYENKSGEENVRQEMTPDKTISSEILSIPVMLRPRSYSAGNIDKEFLTIPTNKSLDNSCSDGKSQMHESEGSTQHQNEFKMRFERAKQFFKHLEQSGPGDIKGRDYSSMPRLDLSNKSRKPSVDSDSGPEMKPQRKRDHFRSRRRRRKKEKDACKIQSAPTSDTETSKRVQRQESYDSFGGSVKIRKVSERFLVKDLFRDVSDKDGFFKGIPNRAAVLASLRSVDDVRAVSPYEMDYGDLKPSTSLGNIPSGFQEEYPYLPTTPIHRFRPRSALGLNLIPRSELLDEKF